MPHPRALLQLSGISRTRIHPCGSWVRPGPAWLRLLHSRSAHSPLPEATLKRSDPCTELSNGLILVLKRESVLEMVLHIRGARGPRSTTASRSLTLQSPGCFSPAQGPESRESPSGTHIPTKAGEAGSRDTGAAAARAWVDLRSLPGGSLRCSLPVPWAKERPRRSTQSPPAQQQGGAELLGRSPSPPPKRDFIPDLCLILWFSAARTSLTPAPPARAGGALSHPLLVGIHKPDAEVILLQQVQVVAEKIKQVLALGISLQDKETQ